jgi:hypothetical protein
MTKWTPEAIRALGPTTDLPTLLQPVLDVLGYDAGAAE